MAFVFVFRPGFSNSILLVIRKTRAVASSSSSTEFSLFSQELALAPRHPNEFSLFRQGLTLAPRHRYHYR